MNSPLEQFIIKPIVRINNNWIDWTISNSTIYTIITVMIVIGLININNNRETIIKNRYGTIIEQIYVKIEEIGKELIPIHKNEGKTEGYIKYIPMLTTIFAFILINNVIGLIPYSFTTTSHIIVTVTMSLSIMLGVTIIGVKKHKLGFIKLFIPSGLDKGGVRVMIPLIFFIEVISYLIRIVSLSVRLTANLMSGHTLLKIIANFGLKYTLFMPILMIIPVGILSAIYLLEIGVAIIQAYVFTLLTTTYIKDAELLH